MDTVEIISSIFGPALLFMGIWVLFYKQEVLKVVEASEKSETHLYFMGFLNLLLGLGILAFYSEWTASLDVLVTMLGWFLFIRGLFCYFIPNFVHKLMVVQKDYTLFSGLVAIFWGGALCYIGFMY